MMFRLLTRLMLFGRWLDLTLWRKRRRFCRHDFDGGVCAICGALRSFRGQFN